MSYLAHGSITIRECVEYIYDPDTTLTFDLNVKFMGFMIWFCVKSSAILSFDIFILCLACERITMVRCVAYIHELGCNMAEILPTRRKTLSNQSINS